MGPGAVEAIRSQGEPADYGICGICIGPEGIALLENNGALAIVGSRRDLGGDGRRLLTKIDGGGRAPGRRHHHGGMMRSPRGYNPWADARSSSCQPGRARRRADGRPQLWENELSELWTRSHRDLGHGPGRTISPARAYSVSAALTEEREHLLRQATVQAPGCADVTSSPDPGQRYLEAEIEHVQSRLLPTDMVLELGCSYGRVTLRLADAARTSSASIRREEPHPRRAALDEQHR
jgi:hypothetical protein